MGVGKRFSFDPQEGWDKDAQFPTRADPNDILMGTNVTVHDPGVAGVSRNRHHRKRQCPPDTNSIILVAASSKSASV